MRSVFEHVELPAKTEALAEAATTPFTGLEGVFVQLLAEHRQVAALIERVKTTEDAKRRAELWAELSAELLAHERAELQEVYAAFAAYQSLEGITNDHEQQADKLELLVAELDAVAVGAPEWHEGLLKIEAAVKRHVLQEETQFFPRAQVVMEKAQAQQLEAPYRAAKAQLMRNVRSR